MNSIQIALDDLTEGLANWRLWYRMSVLDIRRRYRRTLLGPFWTSMSMAIFVFGLGMVFANLWKLDIQEYIPFLVSGFIVWFPIVSVILEGTTLFVSVQGVVSQMPTPYSLFAINLVMRNLIVLAHHMLVYALVAAFLTVDLNGAQFLAIPGIMIIMFNGIWISMVVGVICARFRDLTPLFGNFMQIMAFLSPIFWPPELLGNRGIGVLIIQLNPFFHFVEIVRGPLLGRIPSSYTYTVVGVITVVGWVFGLWFFGRYRHRLIYWL